MYFSQTAENLQFYITLRDNAALDGKNEIIGYISSVRYLLISVLGSKVTDDTAVLQDEGFKMLEYLNDHAKNNGRFSEGHDFRIGACGLLTSPGGPIDEAAPSQLPYQQAD